MTPLGSYPIPRIEATPQILVFRFGEKVLDEQAVGLVRRHFRWLGRARRELHLDLRGVEVPTAGSLGWLVALHRDLQSVDGSLVLANVEGTAYQVFQLTGLTELLDVRPRAENA